MGKCKRCGKYMFKNTQNGFCQACDKVYSKEKEIEKERLEKERLLLKKYYQDEIDQNTMVDAIRDHVISVNCYYTDDDRNEALLSMAISKKHYDLIDCLIKNQCDVNLISWVETRTEFGRCFSTPLFTAIYNNDAKALDMLLRSGADICIRTTHDTAGISCLSAAASRCDVDLVKRLIESGADPNEEDFIEGGTSVPLYEAITNKKYDNARALIDAGADVNYVVRDPQVDYALLNWTVYKNDMIGFELLMDAHADPNCVRATHTGWGDNPALCDAVSERRFAMIPRLIKAGARKDSYVNLNGRKITLIEMAYANGDSKMIRLLNSYGIY